MNLTLGLLQTGLRVQNFMQWIHSCSLLDLYFSLRAVARFKRLYSRFADQLFFFLVKDLRLWDSFYGFESQRIQPHLCLNLRINAITRHFHTPGFRDVPLTGIHSIRHPEYQLFDIPIYETSDGFRMLYISLEFTKFLPWIKFWNFFFHVPRKPFVCKHLETSRKRGSFLALMYNCSLWRTYITPVIRIPRNNIPRYFDGYFEIFELPENSAISRNINNDVSYRTGWETTLTPLFIFVRRTSTNKGRFFYKMLLNLGKSRKNFQNSNIILKNNEETVAT